MPPRLAPSPFPALVTKKDIGCGGACCGGCARTTAAGSAAMLATKARRMRVIWRPPFPPRSTETRRGDSSAPGRHWYQPCCAHRVQRGGVMADELDRDRDQEEMGQTNDSDTVNSADEDEEFDDLDDDESEEDEEDEDLEA